MVLSALHFQTNTATFLVLSFVLYTLLFKVERSSWLEIPTTNMQQIRFNYSLKNIDLPTQDNYLRNLIDKTQNFIQRIRWKAHFFLHNKGESNHTRRTNTYDLKSKHSASPVTELKPFEDDVAKMIENIKLRNVNCNFIKGLFI